MSDGSLRMLDEMASRLQTRPADGTVPGPHWTLDAGGSSLGMLLDDVPTSTLSLSMATEVFSSGMNVALQRWPTIETETVLAPKPPTLLPAWKPTQPKVTTFGITFPEGVSFLAAKEEAAKPDSDKASSSNEEELTPLEPPQPVSLMDGEALAEAKKMLTRIKPPADALSIEDRLFYLLQPPLQSWLGGQELIMPFEPFPYQYEGIGWLFSKSAALLADEMGLGKTMQTITAIRLLIRSGQIRRVLLVCPKPLLPNWQREFRAWAEELPFVVVEGDTERRRLTWTMPGVPILIANYESLVRDFASFEEGDFPKFDLVVLDEAQRIKNRESRTAETARALPRRRSWALTGTPIENRPEELAALYEFLGVIPPHATPDLKQLQYLAKQCILRRTKDLVMKDLPPRLDRDAHLELLPSQKIAYDMAEKDGVIHLNELGDQISVQHVFELVLRLKQITNFDPLTGESAKLDRLEADMEEVAASGGKAGK